MEKVNEKQWASVCRVGGRVVMTSWDRETIESRVKIWPMSLRLARVQITEIEEVEDDKG